MRVLFLGHRWLGLTLGPLVLLWFLSGLVMLFVPYPSLTDSERFSQLQPLARAQMKITPTAAWQALQTSATAPEKIEMVMLLGRPQYVFTSGGLRHAVWADTAQAVHVDRALAIRSALAFRPAPGVIDVRRIALDQWSFSGKLNAHRPLYKVVLQDDAGSEVYVSSRTGEVVLESTRRERLWNWLGSVTHWLYFTELRAHRDIWRQLILWPAAAGVALSIAGLWIGIRRMRLTQRYSRQRHTPYRGWLRIHHVAGYGFGLLVLTWLFSGWLSMTPMDWLSARALSATESSAWHGTPQDSADWTLPGQIPPMTQRLEWSHFAGAPLLIAQQGQQRRRIHPVTGQPQPLTQSALIEGLHRLQPQARLLLLEKLPATGDAYYKPGTDNIQIVRAEFDDSAATRYDIDLQTAEIVASHDRRSRAYRWLFTALHTWDFPGIEPQFWRKVLIVLCSIAGLTIVSTGLLQGIKRLR